MAKKKGTRNWFSQNPKYYNKSLDKNALYKTHLSPPSSSSPPPPLPPSGPRPGNVRAEYMKDVTSDQCFWNDCRGHKKQKITVGYCTRGYWIIQQLNSDYGEKTGTIKIPRTEPRGEGSEKTITDVKSLQLQADQLLKHRDQNKYLIAIKDTMIEAGQATIVHQKLSLEIGNRTLRIM